MPRHGGRQRGTRNKATQAVRDRLAALDCDPVAALAQIAMGPANDVTLRARVLADLLPYCAPKLRATEMTLHADPAEAPTLVIGFLEHEEPPT